MSRFRFSIANLLGFVALAAVSMATFTNQDPLFDLFLLGITTVVLLLSVLMTWRRGDDRPIGIVGAMVVYYALTRFVLYAIGTGHGPPMLPYVLTPYFAVSVGLVAAVVFLLRVRFGSHSVAIILGSCFLCLAAIWSFTLRSIHSRFQPDSQARNYLAQVFGRDVSQVLALIEVGREEFPSTSLGLVIRYEVWDGAVKIGYIELFRQRPFWWGVRRLDFNEARQLLEFAKRRLADDPTTAEEALRTLIKKHRGLFQERTEALLLLERIEKERSEGIGQPEQATAKVGPVGVRVDEGLSEAPGPAVDFSATQEQAVAEIERLGGRAGVSTKGPEELPGTDITWVDWSRTKITDRHFALLRAIPHLQMVDLSETAVGDDHLAHLRGLDQLQELIAHQTNVTGSGLEHLKGSKLHTLSIGGGRLSELRLQHIGGLTALEYLHLNGPVTDECLKHLEGLHRLNDLSLTDDYPNGVKVTDAGLAHLAGLVQLKELTLECPQVTDVGLVHLRGLTNLETLSVGADISDAGMAHLAHLRELRRLSIGGAAITDAGLAHLRALTRLEDLSIYTSQITDAGMVHLRVFSAVENLSLSSAQISDAGLVHLAELTNLRRLSLSSPRITGDGFKMLSGLVQLESLSVRGSPITDAGLAHLAPLSNLRQLWFYGTEVSDAGLVHLKRLPQLEQIDLRYTNVTPAGAEVLRKALPNARLFYDPKAQKPRTEGEENAGPNFGDCSGSANR